MTDRIFLGHTTDIVTATATLPAGVVQFAAGDVVGDATDAKIVMDDCARSDGGAGMITGLKVIDSANQATKPDLEVWIFNAPLAVVAGNAPFAPTDAELLSLVGIVELDQTFVGLATVGVGGNCVLKPQLTPSLSFRCTASTKDLYVYLVERGTYTPVASETLTVIMDILQDY